MNTSQEQTQKPDKLGEKVVAEPVPNTQGWRPYKPGFEINNHGQLRTIAKT